MSKVLAQVALLSNMHMVLLQWLEHERRRKWGIGKLSEEVCNGRLWIEVSDAEWESVNNSGRHALIGDRPFRHGATSSSKQRQP